MQKNKDTREKIVIEGEQRMFVLYIDDFDKEIDTDDILKIDFTNILGEVLTFSVLLNRVGLMRAEMAKILSDKKLAVEIYEANIKRIKRKELSRPTATAKEGSSLKLPSNDMVADAVILDEGVQQMRSQLFSVQRNFDILDAFYWACKSKDDKLNKLSEKLRPQEFEGTLIEDKINGIVIKSKRKLIN